MKVYEAVAKAMVAEGVEAVFGLMGDGNLKLLPHLTTELDVAFYSSRHEAGCVAMAEGYARVADTVGVCTFTQGPGLTNAMTALVSAQRGGSPLLVLCGDTPTVVSGLPQDIEQRPILAAGGIAVQEIDFDDPGPGVVTAFRRARAERRPIALVLPTDLQDRECAWTDAPPADPPAPPAAPDEEALALAAQVIDDAERPVVIAGQGARLAGARDAIVALADRTGALLATSLLGKAWFDGHPYNVGIAGGFSSERTRRLIMESDCVIVFGASLNHFTSRGGTLFAAGATIVQCDVGADAPGRFTPVTHPVLGDARLTAQELLSRVRARDGYRTDEVRAELAEPLEAVDESEPEAADPRAVSAAIDRALPEDRTLVIDAGHFVGFPSSLIAVPEPTRFVSTMGFGSIGLGLATAVGAAVARPDAVTVAAVGDGGLMMSLSELDTAVRYGLRILILVYDDQAYGAELHFLRMLGLDESASRFRNPPLDAIARAIGADGHSVRSVPELEAVLGDLASLSRPLLLDCHVTQNVRAGWLEEAFQRAAH
jgi:thiamine pyrophosphate-dependent acetolactate synthase large subunit-like protein